MLTINQFVSVTTNMYGLGKVKRIEDGIIDVEYFINISNSFVERYDAEDIIVEKIYPQTRCYVYHQNSEEWKIGRYRRCIDGLFEVDFPNVVSEYIHPRDIFVRCNLPIDDPTNIIAYQGHETVYFYERRNKFLRNLLDQRKLSGGLHGLMSAAIHFYPHQIETARKILEDPIPKYLLADEVGLGKTIEAGIVIRQMMLDNAGFNTLIITPPSLVKQWQTELSAKFHTDQWPDQVHFVTSDEVSKSDIKEKYDLVVIDEAHHVAKWYFSQSDEIRNKFFYIQRLAHQAHGLLLLSATPALNNEEAFLAMLNLLDPVHYSLERKEDFTNLIEKRAEIADTLFLFAEEMDDEMVKLAMIDMKNLFAADSKILQDMATLSEILNGSETNVEIRNRLIRKIRLSITEGYRIHHRIIRHRRKDIWDVKRRPPLTVDYSEDEREQEILHKLHDWRLYVLDNTEPNSLERKKFESIYFAFYSALGSSLSLFYKLVEYRLKGMNKAIVEQNFEDQEVQALTRSLLKDEMHYLNEMLSIFQHDTLDIYSREDLLIDKVHQLSEHNHIHKIVVFVSFTWTTCRLQELFTEAFDQNSFLVISREMGQTEVQDKVSTFKQSSTHRFLISDSIGEEGLNLQFIDTILHYDLPWSPNRLEQRIGRLDRIGQSQEIRTYILQGSIEEDYTYPLLAYYQLLHEGIKIFERSINSLQFIIEQLIPEFKQWLFEEGGNLDEEKIKFKIHEVSEKVQEEEKKISSQDNLDRLTSLENANLFSLEDLKEYESKPNLIQTNMDPWICGALLFYGKVNNGIFNYSWTEKTLVPIDKLLSNEDVAKEFSGCYDRNIASDNGVSPIRIGNPFIDYLVHLLSWDDRGKAYAILRKCHGLYSDWYGFKFDILVEANASNYRAFSPSPLVQTALKRRVDAIFPPYLMTIYVDFEGNVVTNEEEDEVRQFLFRSISKYDQYSNLLGYDYNLTKEKISLLKDLCTEYQWRKSCHAARDSAKGKITGSEKFNNAIAEGIEILQRSFEQRLERITIHQKHAFDRTRVLQLQEQKIHELLAKSIQSPSVKIDSVGFIWLSSEADNLLANYD